MPERREIQPGDYVLVMTGNRRHGDLYAGTLINKRPLGATLGRARNIMK